MEQFLHFPPIEKHGAIGDRQTGALVVADGTLDWFCAPDFDSAPVFGALLDPKRGGFCRLGPATLAFGSQRYAEDTAVLLTTWPVAGCELADTMASPAETRPNDPRGRRVILRRLRAVKDAAARFELQPRRNFFETPAAVHPAAGGAIFSFGDGALSLWSSFPLEAKDGRARATLDLRAGEEHWVVLGWNVAPEEWSAERAREVFAAAADYWRDWSAELKIENAGERVSTLRRSALTVQLLSHGRCDSAVAALTTSLPEQPGGERNYDYRYAWVRDASLSLALLARMGKSDEVRRYLDWLCRLPSTTAAPLQVCYRLDGNPHLEQKEIEGVRGYRDSRPVRRGNRAAKQIQLGAMGFFADCARISVDQGGEWRVEFWQMLKRAAEFTAAHWQEKDNGIWELPQKAHYVSSRVMSWVILQRALHIAEKTGHAAETEGWATTAATIQSEVLEKGWSEKKKAFRQRYDSDALDAAALLIPLMEFLPIDHPQVVSTLAALEDELIVHGLMHRFDPTGTLGAKQLPIGEFEGAFLPCVFWHAHTLALADRADEAEAILARCEAIAGGPGLFAEEVDAKNETFLGNTPLLFSHVEYVRAVVALNQARSRAPQPQHAKIYEFA